MTTAPDDNHLVGHTINGAYAVSEKIAVGGMGVVYRGEQLAVGREVAIKVLRLESEGTFQPAERLVRFQREALAMSRLKHPNTCQLIDFGRDDETGRPFLVLELIDGVALNQILEQERRLAPERVLRLARQLAGALDEAHGYGIVHRDMKPDNVLVVDFAGAPDFVKLIDFGIASSNGGTPRSKRLTTDDVLLGSPYYMAPEQVRGQPVGPRTDVYALGVMLYEMLAGFPPFDGPSVIETMYLRLENDPPELFIPDAPDRLTQMWDGLIRSMLAIDPADRPTMAQVRAHLSGFDKRTTSEVARDPTDDWYSATPFVDEDAEDRGVAGASEPRNWLAIAAIALLALGGGAFALAAGSSDPPPRVDGRALVAAAPSGWPGAPSIDAPAPDPEQPVAPEPEPAIIVTDAVEVVPEPPAAAPVAPTRPRTTKASSERAPAPKTRPRPGDKATKASRPEKAATLPALPGFRGEAGARTDHK